MKKRSMLKDIKLEASSNVDLLDRILQTTARIEAQDQAVIDHIKIRGSNKDFRNKVKEALKTVSVKRGPKPDGLPAIAFFELIKAIRKSYKLTSITSTLEIYCELHGLALDKVSSLEDKYRRGREEKAKK